MFNRGLKLHCLGFRVFLKLLVRMQTSNVGRLYATRSSMGSLLYVQRKGWTHLFRFIFPRILCFLHDKGIFFAEYLILQKQWEVGLLLNSCIFQFLFLVKTFFLQTLLCFSTNWTVCRWVVQPMHFHAFAKVLPKLSFTSVSALRILPIWIVPSLACILGLESFRAPFFKSRQKDNQ